MPFRLPDMKFAKEYHEVKSSLPFCSMTIEKWTTLVCIAIFAQLVSLPLEKNVIYLVK